MLPTGDHTLPWPLQPLREGGKHAKRHSSPTHTGHAVSVDSERRAGPKWNVTRVHCVGDYSWWGESVFEEGGSTDAVTVLTGGTGGPSSVLRAEAVSRADSGSVSEIKGQAKSNVWVSAVLC